MRVQASAGSDRKRDLHDYCHNLRLVAETEEEARWLAVLHRCVLGREEGETLAAASGLAAKGSAVMWGATGVASRGRGREGGEPHAGP